MNCRKYYEIILIIFTISSIHAQTIVSNFKSFGNYSGTEKYNIITKDTIQIKHGNYLFFSDLITSIKNGKFTIKELSINGSYLQN
ncbi:hypothetical protein DES35_101848 [Schleiferia thermophila]|uniref:Uncharacterized protein n=1 Tax=Schleiferia thermophila TaxID=884107 RepID=A0A369A8W0_9FLAO|nr:hypothetical protein DES35_101848 [Schleiferia thermophila]GCD78945.1 hypothetical protein JCM30197_01920 [Schleiferia thermophila]